MPLLHQRHALLCARERPFSKLLRSPFLLNFDLRETSFRKPPSSVLFFVRLQYRPFWKTSRRFDLRETSVTVFTFSQEGFFWVESLQSSPDIVCYGPGSVLFSVSVYHLFLCSIFFFMYKFDSDHFSSSLGSIWGALTFPVSRGRHGKLVDNFSHESALQDPFTSRP